MQYGYVRGYNKSNLIMKKLTLKIFGMHCTSCAFNIDGELEDLDGVKESSTNYAKQLTEVVFDPVKVTSEAIIAAIKKLDTSYDAEVITK